MARKPEKKVVITPKIQQAKFNLSDSFTSLLLGVVVVIAAIVLFFSFVRGDKQEIVTPPASLPAEKISQELGKTNKDEVKENIEESKSLYTVAEGDTLWSISEKYYNSGFDWQKIAKANSITNPVNLEKGTKLSIPGAQNAQSTVNAGTQILATNTVAEEKLAKPQGETKGGSNAISGDSYKIVRGDDLWDIAVRAYGDGYKWTEIAKANNLSNPDLIHADNVLKLPR